LGWRQPPALVVIDAPAKAQQAAVRHSDFPTRLYMEWALFGLARGHYTFANCISIHTKTY
jgi:hypothetical protein